MSLKFLFQKFLRLIAAYVLLFNIAALIWVFIYAYFPIPITKLMLIEKQSKSIDYRWIPLSEISEKLQLAVMCAEDQFFLLHNGLDFKSIDKAVASNADGEGIRGASTITQQVAKNVFLWPERSWIRKGAELYFTLLIEMIWNKERIMEVYLNVAEMGDGVFGAEAASQYYFKSSANNLTTRQAASLAAVLPSPKRYSINNPSSYVLQRINWITKQMGYWGFEMTYDEEVVKKMTK